MKGIRLERNYKKQILIYMLLTIKYQNRVKQLNLDGRINVQSLQILLGQLFNIKNKVIGLIDSDGNYFDLVQFVQQLNQTRCNKFTLVSDDGQPVTDNKLYQTTLKYSSTSEYNNKLHFIDFIYDMEEFQNMLGDEQYTCIYLIDENDGLGFDFLIGLEPLINNLNPWINFYYCFNNRLHDQNREYDIQSNTLWVYKGSKRIVSIQLNNDKKMKQIDEILQKLVQTKILGHSVMNSNIRNQSQLSSQQSPEKRRSKSIRKLVEESQIHTNQGLNNSKLIGSRYSTRVQAQVIQREASRGSDIPEDQVIYNLSNPYESIINQQNLLFRVVAELEDKNLLDITMTRLVKKLLIEENKEIIAILLQYSQRILDIQGLCVRLNNIIEKSTNQQRPASPFQNLKQTKQPVNNNISESVEDVKKFIMEKYNCNFTSEQYGIINHLWSQKDQVVIRMCTDICKKEIKKEQVSLKPLQLYADTKFNELLNQNFKKSEITIIQEQKNSKSGFIYATLQHFRYETNVNYFIDDLRKSLQQIHNQNQLLTGPEKQTNQQSKEINLFKFQSSKAPSPFCVLMPKFQNLVNESLSPPPQPKLQQQDENGNNYQSYGKISDELKRVQLFQNFPIQPMQQEKQQEAQQQSSQQNDSKQELSQKKSNNVAIQDLIVSEENFIQRKQEQRIQYDINIQKFYSIQIEMEINQNFQDMISQMDLDEKKLRQVEQLFSDHNEQLYEIIKGFNSSRIVMNTRAKLIKLLSEKQNDTQDYRKTKMYNLFMNQVRQFTLQKHLQENEKVYLLKMFKENDLQVLGTLETYLQNQDAEDMLETLKMIIKQYSKFTNINQVGSDLSPLEQPQLNTPVLGAKEILSQIKQYFSAEEKSRLETIASGQGENSIIELYSQYQQDQDLNGFIAAIKKLSQQDSLKKSHQFITFEDLLKKLQKDGQLKIDDYMLNEISKKKNEQRIKGVFEIYLYSKNIDDFVESIKSILRLLRQQMIQQLLEQLETENLLSENQLLKLKEIAHEYHKDHAKLVGAFSLYWEQSQTDPEGAKNEILETLNIFVE
ncbi:unnamed protein product (macronuclear) [Paramecium tetraurelia]|uniref:Uncharacterized protein n=1 Tax=Paramecium tetraurelia TaxID=5888 RepID=A0E7W6_PARTE|nr:uncharacterized protein GSPATT00024111001 [Paramecium tetraurelia]CAK91383.1 unnamed protein product [Paramecium tetraurelia]|eukprot:XP_001458780.1 hypothetical protein (macronuclear) [Paramecium tetraurelia strain d4-2]